MLFALNSMWIRHSSVTHQIDDIGPESPPSASIGQSPEQRLNGNFQESDSSIVQISRVPTIQRRYNASSPSDQNHAFQRFASQSFKSQIHVPSPTVSVPPKRKVRAPPSSRSSHLWPRQQQVAYTFIIPPRCQSSTYEKSLSGNTIGATSVQQYSIAVTT